jgi:hypothetical protein
MRRRSVQANDPAGVDNLTPKIIAPQSRSRQSAVASERVPFQFALEAKNKP